MGASTGSSEGELMPELTAERLRFKYISKLIDRLDTEDTRENREKLMNHIERLINNLPKDTA